MLASGVGASPFPATCGVRRQPIDRGHLHHRPGRDAEPAPRARTGRRYGSGHLGYSPIELGPAQAGMHHVRGAPCHPQTQGKIERWHQTLKNRILLENYYLPGDLEAHIGRFVDHYNHRRYHESLQNLTPADVYFGRGQTILLQRERIKRETIRKRRLQHRKKAA